MTENENTNSGTPPKEPELDIMAMVEAAFAEPAKDPESSPPIAPEAKVPCEPLAEHGPVVQESERNVAEQTECDKRPKPEAGPEKVKEDPAPREDVSHRPVRDFISVDEAASMLVCTTQWVYALLRSDRLKGVLFDGKVWLVLRDAVLEHQEKSETRRTKRIIQVVEEERRKRRQARLKKTREIIAEYNRRKLGPPLDENG